MTARTRAYRVTPAVRSLALAAPRGRPRRRHIAKRRAATAPCAVEGHQIHGRHAVKAPRIAVAPHAWRASSPAIGASTTRPVPSASRRTPGTSAATRPCRDSPRAVHRIPPCAEARYRQAFRSAASPGPGTSVRTRAVPPTHHDACAANAVPHRTSAGTRVIAVRLPTSAWASSAVTPRAKCAPPSSAMRRPAAPSSTPATCSAASAVPSCRRWCAALRAATPRRGRALASRVAPRVARAARCAARRTRSARIPRRAAARSARRAWSRARRRPEAPIRAVQRVPRVAEAREAPRCAARVVRSAARRSRSANAREPARRIVALFGNARRSAPHPGNESPCSVGTGRPRPALPAGVDRSEGRGIRRHTSTLPPAAAAQYGTLARQKESRPPRTLAASR
jgi:hypothetical protein